MALKNKSEGEGRVTYYKTHGLDNVTYQLYIMFMILENQNLLSGEE